MDKDKKTSFDIIVLGGGPGGYPAAIRAAQLGKSVAIVEAKELGGTCLNRGCIPSKTLIAGAEALGRLNDLKAFGITIDKVSVDYAIMTDRKDAIVDKMRKGVESLMAANKITMFKGFGKFISPKEIKVTGTDNAIITADKIIIATGSEPRSIPAFPFDYQQVHDSTSLLEMKKLPKSMVIIGGGIIGCEFASLFTELGVKITILEMLPRILPMEAEVVSEALTRAFQKRGIVIKTGVAVAGVDKSKKGITAKLASGESFDADICLVSVGRSLNTSNIGLEKAGVAVSDNGMVPVNDQMETSVNGIYAIGDIASKWWLAHVATHQGIVAATNAAGKTAHMLYNAIPSVIFTHPEIATVGLSLEAAKSKGYNAVIGAFPFQALGKSQAANQADGFAQVVLDQRTGEILGAQVVGHEASSLIAAMTLAITNELTAECIAETIHAHPTIAEAWPEAVMMGLNMPIHLPPRKSHAK